MNGIVTLQGAKLMLGNTALTSTSLIPGDHVSMNSDGTYVLVKREPQVAIGIVDTCDIQSATVCLATLPPACPFRLTLPNTHTYSVGDRLILWLDDNGEYEIRGKYPRSRKFDADCIVAAYNVYRCRHLVPEVYGPNHYTRQERVDLTHLKTFTIDPATSVDFDDAISVDVENSTLYIHIVDIKSVNISHKIPLLCFSLYLANERTEHLLPIEDAAHTYSLIKGAVRNVITVHAKVVDGMVESYEIYPSKILVKDRWSYEQVSEQFHSGTASPEFQMLANLHKKRSKDIEYSLQLPSLRMTIGVNGLPTEMGLEDTNDISHGIISTPMILANLIVSKHLREKGLHLPNRFHDTLRGILKHYKPIDTGNPTVDSFILVKRFAKACYSVDKSGHFGLGLTDYVHFTSPMRRYADVLVHKLLAGWEITEQQLEEEVAHINQRANTCRILQDLYRQWKRCAWISSRAVLDTVYITDVKKVGVMWFMPSLSLNGFTHISNLSPKQFWSWNEEEQYLVGTKTSHKLCLGTKCVGTFQSFSHHGATVNLSLVLLD